MTYQETIEYLYNQLLVYQNVGGSAYKVGLGGSFIDVEEWNKRPRDNRFAELVQRLFTLLL